MIDIDIRRAQLLGSFLHFTQTYYKLLTNRDFYISQPISRESQHISMARALTKVFNLEYKYLYIGIPPGHHKSTMLTFWIPWCFAHYADCNFLYISCTHELATKHTSNIKRIMELPEYYKMFDVHLDKNSRARDLFKTTKGGCVAAFGSQGTIVGQDAGLPGLDRFSGATVMDDMHKPDETSETNTTGVIDNYNNTIKHRARGINVPFVFPGQRTCEGDLPGFLLSGRDGNKWESIILPGLDEAGNPLDPKVKDKAFYENERKFNEYNFYSQYQQNPQPAGGSMFKVDWFKLLDDEPEILETFVTVDTAETDKNYNDPTVFSFFGYYKIKINGKETGLSALHWIDCQEDWIDASDLEKSFMDFYFMCLRHKVPPKVVAVEKKSTGVTLLGALKKIQGIDVVDILRTKASGNKIARYNEIVPYVAQGCISFDSSGKLWKIKDNKMVNMCIEHMSKITRNQAHRHDDIADTLYDAVKISLIDKIVPRGTHIKKDNEIVKKLANHYQNIRNLRERAYGSAAISRRI